jgi:hypothetical protein
MHIWMLEVFQSIYQPETETVMQEAIISKADASEICLW